MKIWIDISNAPHVRFFNDVIKYFENEGEDVLVTARKFGDIHKLMDMYDIDFISVGKHGVTLEEKLKESAQRVVDLADLVAGENFDVALSKHSIELPAAKSSFQALLMSGNYCSMVLIPMTSSSIMGLLN